jgi:hypothetical protein
MGVEVRRPSPRSLPYGSKLVEFVSSGCGCFEEKKPSAGDERLPVFACGMAMPRPGSRRYLRFIG